VEQELLPPHLEAQELLEVMELQIQVAEVVVV
jgi:hypothetical protein